MPGAQHTLSGASAGKHVPWQAAVSVVSPTRSTRPSLPTSEHAWRLPSPGHQYPAAHAASLPCLRAVLCAGLYPNVVRVKPAGDESRFPTLEGHAGLALSLHPSSVNAPEKKFDSGWLVYYEKVRSPEREGGRGLCEHM